MQEDLPASPSCARPSSPTGSESRFGSSSSSVAHWRSPTLSRLPLWPNLRSPTPIHARPVLAQQQHAVMQLQLRPPQLFGLRDDATRTLPRPRTSMLQTSQSCDELLLIRGVRSGDAMAADLELEVHPQRLADTSPFVRRRAHASWKGDGVPVALSYSKLPALRIQPLTAGQRQVSATFRLAGHEWQVDDSREPSHGRGDFFCAADLRKRVLAASAAEGG